MTLKTFELSREVNKEKLTKYIRAQVGTYLSDNIKNLRCKKLSTYINNLFYINTSVKNILLAAVQYLEIGGTNNSYSIYIPEHIYLENVSLNVLLRLIKVGDLNIRGTNIFDNAITYAIQSL